MHVYFILFFLYAAKKNPKSKILQKVLPGIALADLHGERGRDRLDACILGD